MFATTSLTGGQHEALKKNVSLKTMYLAPTLPCWVGDSAGCDHLIQTDFPTCRGSPKCLGIQCF